MQGAYASDGSITAWGNLRWTDRFVTKTQTQIDPRQDQSVVQFDNEYTGADFSLSLKALTPSLMEGGLTGIYIGSYLQAITPRLALGVEGVYQRASMGTKPETAASYCARYKGDDWVASGQVLAAGQMSASYWRRLTEKVEAGVDCSLQFMPGAGGSMFGSPRKEATTTMGVKYNFQASVYRAQVDSAGKLGVVLERRVAPPVTLTFAAEIDQVKVRPFPIATSKANIHTEHSQAGPGCIDRWCSRGAGRDRTAIRISVASLLICSCRRPPHGPPRLAAIPLGDPRATRSGPLIFTTCFTTSSLST